MSTTVKQRAPSRMLPAGLLLAGLLLCACSGKQLAVAPYDPAGLWNLQQGRDYVAQGRYELAKEHYLLALAASNEGETRRIITHELQSVDLMIRTQR